MDCQVCGTQLPAEAKACPNCGTLTPAYYTNSGASPDDPTLPAVPGSSPSVMSAPPPPTPYGANPYDRSLQSPYPVYPYEAPPPLPPQRPGNHIGIIVGVVVLVLLLIGGGVFAWLAYSSARNAAAVTAAQSTATAQAATATAQTVATATANFTAQGTYTILGRTTTSVRQNGSDKIYSITEQDVDHGGVMGSFTSEFTSIVHPDNTANFSGTSTCTCTVAGKSGTLMWSFTGTSAANGSFQGQILNLQGTGDLAKLHGQGVFQGQGTQGTYSDELHFDL